MKVGDDYDNDGINLYELEWKQHNTRDLLNIAYGVKFKYKYKTLQRRGH